MPSIFISYRREDTSPWAGRLYDHLSARFGADRVFMDLDTIRPGDDFVQVISDRVAACDVLIAVIGKRWLATADAQGRRRLDDPRDFVRIEIASALNRNVRVIPTLVDSAVMPGPNDLPADLAALSRRNAIEITNSMFRENVARLIHAIEQTVGPKTAPPILRAFQKRPAARQSSQSAPVGAAPATLIGVRWGWQIFAAAAAFGLIQMFVSAQPMSYPWVPSTGRTLATGILQCAALALIWMAPGRLDRDLILKLTLAWLGTIVFWLIANHLVLAPLVASSGPRASLEFVQGVLQVGAALVFGLAARLIVPAIAWGSVSMLAQIWVTGGLVVWLVRLIAETPMSSALTVSRVLLQGLVGASGVWLVDRERC